MDKPKVPPQTSLTATLTPRFSPEFKFSCTAANLQSPLGGLTGSQLNILALAPGFDSFLHTWFSLTPQMHHYFLIIHAKKIEFFLFLTLYTLPTSPVNAMFKIDPKPDLPHHPPSPPQSKPPSPAEIVQ